MQAQLSMLIRNHWLMVRYADSSSATTASSDSTHRPYGQCGLKLSTALSCAEHQCEHNWVTLAAYGADVHKTSSADDAIHCATQLHVIDVLVTRSACLIRCTVGPPSLRCKRLAFQAFRSTFTKDIAIERQVKSCSQCPWNGKTQEKGHGRTATLFARTAIRGA